MVLHRPFELARVTGQVEISKLILAEYDTCFRNRQGLGVPTGDRRSCAGVRRDTDIVETGTDQFSTAPFGKSLDRATCGWRDSTNRRGL
jgi:hypothetical protein